MKAPPDGRGMRVAGYEVTTAVLTRFRLDGGAMSGSVPKVLWERWHSADAQNRIGLVARVLVLRGEGRCVLVDAGLGEKFAAREADMYAVEPVPEARLPFRWGELTDIVLTHLHFDHAGGVTVSPAEPAAGRDGRAGPAARLRAPAARLHLQRSNWDLARAPGPRERASYLPENVSPLEKGDLRLAEGDRELLPGVTVHPSNGHTTGLQWVKVGDGEGALVFPADIVPTSAHLHLPCVMGYDMCVETLLREKESLLDRAVREGWILVFAHDERVAAARVGRGKDGRFARTMALEI